MMGRENDNRMTGFPRFQLVRSGAVVVQSVRLEPALGVAGSGWKLPRSMTEE